MGRFALSTRGTLPHEVDSCHYADVSGVQPFEQMTLRGENPENLHGESAAQPLAGCSVKDAIFFTRMIENALDLSDRKDEYECSFQENLPRVAALALP